MTISRWAIGGALMGCVVSGLTLMRTAPGTPTDDQIRQRVAARLAAVEGLRHLEVRADGQAVTLKGTLATRDDRGSAIRLAHEIRGVRWVIADVVIDPDGADRARADRAGGASQAEAGVRLSDVYREHAARYYEREKKR